MSAVFIFLVVLLSGDILAVVVFNKRFGEYTPVTICSISLVSYCFGLVRHLIEGVWVIGAATIVLYIIAGVSLIKKHAMHNLRKRLLNSLTISFFVVFALAVWGDYGQLANGYDDIGHWVDCVKTMIAIDDFYANPIGHSTFGTYPPFMAMIQYVMQMLNMKIFKAEFCEWLNFLVFHISMFALFMPLLSLVEEKKNALTMALSTLAVLIIPTVFFQRVFSSTMIDPFLTVSAGVVFVLILERKRITSANIILCLLIPGVVLVKDLGMLFSVFGLILLLISSIKNRKYKTFAIATMGTAFTKISWEIVKAVNHTVDPKPSSVNWWNYANALFGSYGDLPEYKIESVSNYRLALFDKSISVGNWFYKINVSFILILVASIIAYVLWYRYKKRRNEQRILLENLIVHAALFLFFLFGLGGVYMDKFVATEAVTLASYARYVTTALSVPIIELLLLFIIDDREGKVKYIGMILAAVILLSPIPNSIKFVTRQYPVEEGIERADADAFAGELVEHCEDNSTVYLISQRNKGWDYLVVKLMSRPHLALQSIEGDDYNWSFAETANPDDIYTKEMTAEAWSKELFDDDLYDYVAIAKSDAYFSENFRGLFEESVDTVYPHSIYRVDRENRMLTPVINSPGNEL